MGALMSRAADELDQSTGQVSDPSLYYVVLFKVLLFAYLSACLNSQQGHAPSHFTSA